MLIIIIGLGFAIYKVIAKNDGNDLKQKTLSEIEYIEQNLVSLFNLLNNISYENYTLISKPISKDKSSENSDSSNSSGSGKSNSTQESGGGSSGGSESSENNITQEENNEEYELKETRNIN